jgi:hypothetical protein
VIAGVGRLYDRLDGLWHDSRVQRALGSVLIATFLAALLVIEAERQGWLPASARALVPRNHLYAVALAFNFLLFIEIVGLVFSLAGSVANSVGKHCEIFALILLRETFKQLTHVEEPVTWAGMQPWLTWMLADAAGALLIFVIMGLYYRAQRHAAITRGIEDQASFVLLKKGIALLLVLGFIGIAADRPPAFFAAAYTLLIFADVLIVLISLRYNPTFRVAFRYLGFAVTTLFLRIALTAPPPIDALLGVGAAVFAYGLTVAYNAFAPVLGPDRGGTRAAAG